MKSNRLSDLRDFYQLIAALMRFSRPTSLETCTGRMQWPQRGVYFFIEDGEDRSDSGSGARIVRVGTHALMSNSRTTLWNRISQHRGTSSSGGGNHRGSIFRLIVGTSLMKRDNVAHSTWGKGSNAPKSVRAEEVTLERQVSAVLGAMKVVSVSVPDSPGHESSRGLIERNAIALLSNFGKDSLDPPSPEWLGQYCDRERVRQSGLWNSNHVDERHDSQFLHSLERAVAAMELEE